MRSGPLVLGLSLLVACSGPRDPPGRPGDPLAGLGDEELGRFLLGRAVFERIATQEEGLGPLFNADRCSACHDQPAPGGTGPALVVKATAFDGVRCDLLESEGGDNLQQRVTPALAAHGIGAEPVPMRANGRAQVTGPPLFGLGLIEGIPDGALLAHADPDDADRDGVSGRAPVLDDGRVARFGRKGESATIEDFVDTALRFELGLTTPRHPREEEPAGAALPADADPMGEPEIGQRGITLLTEYARFLAPPTRATPASPEARGRVNAGEAIFADLGCTGCHVPELRTGASVIPALDRRPVRAYSDFLLHDLGPEFATVCGARAAPGEWRTAPLWGLRHRTQLHHDGRAASIDAAIEAHGGEAEASRSAWRQLTAEQRASLQAFLWTL